VNKEKIIEQKLKIRTKIIIELKKTIKKLGGGSDILSILGGFDDTICDEEVLAGIKEYNSYGGEQ